MEERLSQTFAYENQNGSAVILRCFSRASFAEIPKSLDGLPVRALAPYAFSGAMDPAVLSEGLAAGSLKITGPEGRSDALPDLPALCGKRLTGLSLPDCLCEIGRYCFYNCANLTEISFPGGLGDWGSGCFTGCHRVRILTVRTEDGLVPSLKQVLGELDEEQSVRYQGGGEAFLIFPGFYEESVENTPARILVTEVHGSGICYRNCFSDGKFDFARYDSLFPSCKALESADLLIRLALGRLRFPFGLEKSAEMRYKGYICEHALSVGKYLIDQKNEADFTWFLENFSSESLLGSLSDYAAAVGNAAAVSLLAKTRRRLMSAALPGRSRMEL